jgi:ATP-dependent exoDNAse (exonuclease V) alpha subunit
MFTNMSSQKLVIVFAGATGEKFKIPARVVGTQGKMAIVNPQASCSSKEILSVYTVGQEGLTNAEEQRERIILTALKTKSTFLEHPLARKIWLPSALASSPVLRHLTPLSFSYRTLNTSQQKAVRAILSNDEITIIQGPPGTGKTTVIAAAVHSVNSTDRERTLWLVAQSNVAVKNMAQKLGETGFRDFKLLVSKDFYVDWCGTPFFKDYFL